MGEEGQDLPQMFARHTFPELDTHPDRFYSCRNSLSDFLCFCPNSSIQDVDGTAEVVRGQKLSANCLAHEDKHCLAGFHFRDRQVMKQDGSLIKLRSISSAPSKWSREAHEVSSSSSSSSGSDHHHLDSFFWTSRATIAHTIFHHHQ